MRLKASVHPFITVRHLQNGHSGISASWSWRNGECKSNLDATGRIDFRNWCVRPITFFYDCSVSKMTDTSAHAAEDPRKRIAAAFTRLAIRREDAWRLPGIVDSLTTFTGRANTATPAKFVKAARATAEKELSKVAVMSENLVEHLSGLHEPAVIALADGNVLVHELIAPLQALSRAAKKADLRGLPVAGPRGRPRKLAVDPIATAVAHYYEKVTGKKPTIVTDSATGYGGGPFLTLLRDVFDAIGLQASALAAARKIVDKSKGEKAQNN